MKLHVKKHFGKLVPCYNSDRDKLTDAKLKEGEIYQVEIIKPRNYIFHKKFFALINLCFDNQEIFEEFEDLREYLIIKAGYFRKVKMPNGYEQIKAKSISFANMDEIEFNDLYNKTIGAICKFIDVSEKDIMDEIINYM